MRKNSIAIISLAFLASCFMVSCSTEAFDTNQPVKGAKIVIPAQKMSTKAVDADGKATFLTSENVYIAKSGTIDKNAIHPSAESASTTFAGTLKETYSQGDKITVLYNTNASGVVDYSGQDGSIGSVKDAGYAEDVEIVSYSEGVLTTESAKIQNLQSIFKFTFYNGSIDEANKISGIRFVRVFSTKNKLVSSYDAKSKSNNTLGPVTIFRSTKLDDNYIYAALRFDSNDGDEIVFQVIDKDGKVYSGSKPAPKDGFKIGKFYESTVTVNLYTFTVGSNKKVCFSPGDLGVDNGVYSFTEPFANWGGTGETDAAKRVYFEGSEARPDKELYDVTWRLQTWTKTSGSNEWENLIARAMNAGVNPYYKVQVGSNKYCVLLPPDETISDDIGNDLTSSQVTDYLKYIAKGFVILMNTNYKDKSESWGTTNLRKWSGYYWTNYSDGPQDRTFFYWYGDSNSAPTTLNSSSAYHCLHVRYVHDL